MRAFIQHPPTTPWKVWYAAPSFRYERTQAGRYRQHHQLGVEAIGTDDPDLDVEVIGLLGDFYRDARAAPGRPGHQLHRHPGRPGRLHRAAAVVPRRPHRRPGPGRPGEGRVPPHAGARHQEPAERRGRGRRAAAGRHALARGRRPLRAGPARASPRSASPTGIDPRLVRGLDYYTHTTFEFRSDALEAAQNTIGGGGRYDGLAESLGGTATPGIGFGSGIERILLTCDAEGVFAAPAARRRRLRRRPHRRRASPATSPSSCAGPGISADRGLRRAAR